MISKVGKKYFYHLMTIASIVIPVSLGLFINIYIALIVFFITPLFWRIPLNLGAFLKIFCSTIDLFYNYLIDQDNVKIFFVETMDGAKLETTEDLTAKNDMYAIIFCGTGAHLAFYQGGIFLFSKFNLRALYRKAGYNIIGFNYRGCYGSIGRKISTEDSVTDGVTQVNRLLDQGVDASNIILHGHSLGGAIAIKVFDYFANKNIIIGLCINENSFGRVWEAFSSFKALNNIIKVLLNLAQNNIEVIKEYQKLYELDLQLNEKHHLILQVVNNDGVISKVGFLSNALKKTPEIYEEFVLEYYLKDFEFSHLVSFISAKKLGLVVNHKPADKLHYSNKHQLLIDELLNYKLGNRGYF